MGLQYLGVPGSSTALGVLGIGEGNLGLDLGAGLATGQEQDEVGHPPAWLYPDPD